jgi:hypothetical protein
MILLPFETARFEAPSIRHPFEGCGLRRYFSNRYRRTLIAIV